MSLKLKYPFRKSKINASISPLGMTFRRSRKISFPKQQTSPVTHKLSYGKMKIMSRFYAFHRICLKVDFSCVVARVGNVGQRLLRKGIPPPPSRNFGTNSCFNTVNIVVVVTCLYSMATPGDWDKTLMSICLSVCSCMPHVSK